MNEAIDVDELKRRYAEVLAERDRLVDERDRLKKRYDKLLLEYERLRRRLLGPTKERVAPPEAQLSLLGVLEALGRLEAGDEGAAAEAEALLEEARASLPPPPSPAKKSKKKHGRRDLSLEDLPVERIVLEPVERMAEGGELLEKIGEEVTEYLDRRPASMVRVQIVRPKYKLPEATSTTADEERRTSIAIADVPELPIPRCMAGPGLLAHVLVSKYADHIPLHRQESIFRREGIRISRSTLCDWVQASTSLLSRIVEAMWDDARKNAAYSITDATGVLVLEKDRCRRAHFYVVVVPQEHVLFRFTTKNDGETVAKLLEGFSGYVHADAASVYHELYRRDSAVVEVGCWAHARRKFFEALEKDRDRALAGIGFISLLYDAHRDALDDKTGIADKDKRARAARPILARLFRWMRSELRSLPDDAPIREALGYLRNQRRALTRFLDDGRLRLDTNPAEL